MAPDITTAMAATPLTSHTMSAVQGPPPEMSGRWYLVRSRPKSEKKAQSHLAAQGFQTYLPQIQRTIRHARKLTTVQVPLFPGYLFIGLDLEQDRWLSVRSTVGVLSLFSHHDGRPIPVPVGVVESLVARSDRNVVRLDTGLVQGQDVRVLSGPFADLIGTLQRVDANSRVQVLLRMMGTEVPVTLHRSALAPAA
jgi:transcription elongation factor/antiterminator RfaH